MINRIFNLLLYLTLGVLLCQQLQATHNRAGEMSFVSAPLPGQPYRYIITTITYTKVSGGGAASADRDSLDINFGDGSPIAKAPRINGPGNEGENIGNNIKKNIYEIEHTYAAPFDYVVSMQDPNRIESILNIQFGRSVEVPFFLMDTIFFRDPQFFGFNSSPVLLQPPIDFANVDYPFVHNPNAFDIDGDSLYFELIPPKSDLYNDVPVYQYPNAILSEDPTDTDPNDIFLNPFTGEFRWETPQKAGIYNIAFLIREFRNGVQIGNMMRDMQIIVEETNNAPPQIAEINDTCIIIGETLQFDVFAADTLLTVQTENIDLTAWGGPFEITPPAMFVETGLDIAQNGYLGTFTWQTDCSHIYSEEYTIVIKAEDTYSPPLADLETWQLTLVPPPPTGLTAQVASNTIVINWDEAYLCKDSPKFRGYSVWRSVGCDDMEITNCQLGLEGTGYVKLVEGLTVNTYTDTSPFRGIEYAYRVLAEFADAFTGSVPPTPINVIASIPSDNVCARLPQDVPIITNVSVQTTALSDGQMYVGWTKPIAQELDTLVNTPPYAYVIYRTQGINTSSPYTLVDSLTANSFHLANDTTYIDVAPAINSQNERYTYKVLFYANGNLVGVTETASSVFLTITPADNQLWLNWDFNVPWLNYGYNIYRQDNAGVFTIVGYTEDTNYTDSNLQNGQSYCYYVEALGTYNNSSILAPLINTSQESCAIPIDTIPPCAPILAVYNDCAEEILDGELDFENVLDWNNVNEHVCADDVIGYNIYYSSPLNPDYELLDSLRNDPDITIYQHELVNSLAGCYAVTAIDSFYNESGYSNIVCVENCVEFELPNVFTPNNDGDNDLFVPRKSRFVSSISFRVSHQWGGLVFETNNPAIEWDGKHIKTQQQLPDGVYFYTCDVYEQSSNGIEIVNQQLSGFIHIINGN